MADPDLYCIGSLLALALFIVLMWITRQGWKTLNRGERKAQRDMGIGILGMIGLNGVLFLGVLVCNSIVSERYGPRVPSALTTAMWLLPWIVNIGLLVLFGVYRPKIALGAITLVGFLLIWGIVLSVLFVVSCLALGGIVALLDSIL